MKLPSNRVMATVAAILGVIVAWLYGTEYGEQKARSEFTSALADQQAAIGSIHEEYQSAISRLREQRDISDASVRSLQQTITNMEQAALEQASTSSLFKRIEGIDSNTGLAVDTVELIAAAKNRSAELHITLIQARGRDRVKGVIGLALVGEKNDSNWREVIVQTDNAKAPVFDLRFFQTLIVPLPEVDMIIDLLEIRVEPLGKPHKPFKHEIDWPSLQKP